MRVIGIDTALRSTGIAVVEGRGSRTTLLAHETLRVPAHAPHTECLRCIVEGLTRMAKDVSPDAASIEGIFHARNPKTAVILGQARGAAMVACLQRNLPLYEYAPRRVKQAVCGSGNASKTQIARMVAAVLALSCPLPEDESDAAALAVCHLHHVSTVPGLGPKAL